jgi:hypothetical protein
MYFLANSRIRRTGLRTSTACRRTLGGYPHPAVYQINALLVKGGYRFFVQFQFAQGCFFHKFFFIGLRIGDKSGIKASCSQKWKSAAKNAGERQNRINQLYAYTVGTTLCTGIGAINAFCFWRFNRSPVYAISIQGAQGEYRFFGEP